MRNHGSYFLHGGPGLGLLGVVVGCVLGVALVASPY
jgi:hypothetical protein